MTSLQYVDASVGLTVAFDFATDLLKISFTDNIWFAIARVIIRSIDKALLTPLRTLIIKVNQFRESIIIEWEASKARIRVGKLIKVTEEYEKGKEGVRNLVMSPQAKEKLIANLDTMLDKHIKQILEVG